MRRLLASVAESVFQRNVAPQTLEYTFANLGSESPAIDSFSLDRLTTGASIGRATMGYAFDPQTNKATVTPNPSGAPAILEDGWYEAIWSEVDSPLTAEHTHHGWHFVKLQVNTPGLPPMYQWIQIDPGAPPIIPWVWPAPRWQPADYQGSLADLAAQLEALRALRGQVLVAIRDLGTEVQALYDLRHSTDDAIDQRLDQSVDRYDHLLDKYNDYVSAHIQLYNHAGRYQSSLSANWKLYFDNPQYVSVMSGILAMPRDIGGLSPTPEFNQQMAAAFENFGEGAAIMARNADRIFEVAKATHSLFEKAEYTLALGTGGTYTVASLVTKRGLAHLARTVMRNYVIDEAAGEALSGPIVSAMEAAQHAGIDPHLIRGGLLGMQAMGVVKAAKTNRVAGQSSLPVVSLTFRTRSAAFVQAKQQHGIPRSAQPYDVIGQNDPRFVTEGLRYPANIRLYKFRDHSGREIWIREDLPGVGQTQPHFNAGPGGHPMNLESHFFWTDER